MEDIKEQLKINISTGELEGVKKLIEQHYFPPDEPVFENYSMLHFAAQRGHSNVISFLLDIGANVDIRDSAGFTPLHFAALEGNLDCVKILMERGADISAVNTELMIIIEKTFPVYVIGGRTPLHIAAENGDFTTVQYLVGEGAKVELKDYNDYTAFHLASLGKHDDVAEFLNPFPGEAIIQICDDEYMWRWQMDYQKVATRMANKLVGNVEGMTRDCCTGCRHLLSLNSPH
eukprot:TRINITY_DN7864_c0_g1_i1.p1 TRINITY_DN7864_c0_g1~~TRINITY_DN7864_c0_g1_i1.p1  ORF type:complete len:232 (+),score=31.83 TRINITY_DN7864_c0_g1_i1:85-780(+)